MTKLPASLERLINEFSKLPGIGPKSAQRLALFLLKKDSIELNNLASSVSNLKEGVVFCDICFNMADNNPCSTCSDPNRDQSLICIVEEPLDALALDKTKGFEGVFHVLGGVLNPMEGIGPAQLNLTTLKDRIKKQGVREVIIATNPTLEGETTAMYISKLLADDNIIISRIARGLPMGGDLEYADEMTLSRALEGRRAY